MTASDPTLAAAATRLARRGWPVLACYHPMGEGCSCGHQGCESPAKHPRLHRGLHAASTDAAVVRRWWDHWPAANVAVRTGAAPDGAGLVVLDIDPAHGGDASLAALVDEHGPLSVTLSVATGSGGRHLYWRHPGGVVPNSAGRLGAGLDVRGDGGYVLVPPSRHISGSRYRWQPAPIQPLPTWLHTLLLPPPTPTPTRAAAWIAGRSERIGAWAAAAVAGEAATVRAAVEGTRNDTLNRAAFSLGQLVAGGHLDAEVVTATLTHAALAAGLGERETRATIASGLRAAADRPRHPARR